MPRRAQLDDDKPNVAATAERPRRHLRLTALGLLVVVMVVIGWVGASSGLRSLRGSFLGRQMAGISTLRFVNQTGNDIAAVRVTVEVTRSSTTETQSHDIGEVRSGESRDIALRSSDIYPSQLRYRTSDGRDVVIDLEGIATLGEIAMYTITPDGVTGPDYVSE